MKHSLTPVVIGMALGALLAVPGVSAAANQTDASVTFHKDVAPILREKCQRCHAPGEMAPMPLITYQQVRPWARAMRLKVSNRQMPPWFIDRTIGIQNYKNDTSLSDEQIATIVKWIDAGTPEGVAPAAQTPAQAVKAQGAEGWAIGKPDLIVKKSKPFKMYANGSDWWDSDFGETGLTEDRWVKAAELKPGSRKIVHHFCSSGAPAPPAGAGPGGPGGPPAAGVGPVGPAERYAQENAVALLDEIKQAGEGFAGAAAGAGAAVPVPAGAGISAAGFGCYLPGNGAKFYTEDAAILLKAGSRISFGMHYSAAGEEATDQSEVGLVFFPKGVTPKHVVKGGFFQKFPAFEIDIPPNSKRTFDAYMTLPKPTLLMSFQPHMHMRGNALVLEAILPTGRVITISAVKNYNFAWQMEYVYADDEAPLLPAGTMLHAIVTMDNTKNNPFNPDPNRWVGYGQASAEEMAGSFVTYAELDQQDYLKRTSERRAAQRAKDTQQQ